MSNGFRLGLAFCITMCIPDTALYGGMAPGLWKSADEDVEFYVTSDGTKVENFSISIFVSGCGDYKITHPGPLPIVHGAFSFTGNYSASGSFASDTSASGQYGLNHYDLHECGLVNLGPLHWDATCDGCSPVPTYTPASSTPTPIPTLPIDLTTGKTEFKTTDSISVTADVSPLTVPCYPFVRILMADGSTLYYQSGVGFTASPVPYLGFEAGTIVTTEPIRDYQALSANFSGIATGTYYLEGGAVDMTKTTSASNLVYFGTVDREELKVR